MIIVGKTAEGKASDTAGNENQGSGAVVTTDTTAPTKHQIEAGRSRPPIPSPDLTSIPDGLTTLDQWVLWRYASRLAKWTKIPMHVRRPGGRGPTAYLSASATDPATWHTFDAAAIEMTWYEELHDWPRRLGLGFVLAAHLGITVIDLDDCRDPVTGAIAPWAQAIIDRLASYTEVSPSGTGVKVYIIASKPGPRCRPSKGHPLHGRVEVYDGARFVAVTGDRLDGTPADLVDRQAELDACYAEWFPGDEMGETSARDRGHDDPLPPLKSLALSDEEIIDRARRASNGAVFVALWAGDRLDYASGSEADLALAGRLAFYVGPDPDRIEALMRSSGLRRRKWDAHRKYLQQTIEKALRGRTVFYGDGRQDLDAELAGMPRVTWGRSKKRGGKTSDGSYTTPAEASAEGEPPPLFADPEPRIPDAVWDSIQAQLDAPPAPAPTATVSIADAPIPAAPATPTADAPTASSAPDPTAEAGAKPAKKTPKTRAKRKPLRRRPHEKCRWPKPLHFAGKVNHLARCLAAVPCGDREECVGCRHYYHRTHHHQAGVTFRRVTSAGGVIYRLALTLPEWSTVYKAISRAIGKGAGTGAYRIRLSGDDDAQIIVYTDVPLPGAEQLPDLDAAKDAIGEDIRSIELGGYKAITPSGCWQLPPKEAGEPRGEWTLLGVGRHPLAQAKLALAAREVPYRTLEIGDDKPALEWVWPADWTVDEIAEADKAVSGVRVRRRGEEEERRPRLSRTERQELREIQRWKKRHGIRNILFRCSTKARSTA